MAWIKGTATDFRSAIEDLHDFATKSTKAGTPVKVKGAISGDGTLDLLNAQTGAQDETWTLTATSSTEFSVVGSVSGTQSSATVDVEYDNFIIDFTLTAGTIVFEIGDVFEFSVLSEVPSSVSTRGSFKGSGKLLGQTSTSESVLETITFTCTTGGSSAVFGVVGSVTGILSDITVNEVYSNTVISCLISSGITDYVIGDVITLEVTTITPLWEAMRYIHTAGAEYDLILKGLGYSGSDEIFVGAQSYEDTTGANMWRPRVFTGFNDALDTEDQPGSCQSNTYVPMTEVSITFWFFVSPQRIAAVFLSGSVYTHMYIGWLNALATPSQWTYPMFLGGSHYIPVSYTDTGSLFRSYWNPHTYYTTAHVLDGSTWTDTDDSMYTFPTTSFRDMSTLEKNNDGSVPEIPMHIMSINTTSSTNKAYGTLEDINAPAHLSGVLSVEDLLIGEDQFSTVFQDIYKAATLCSITMKEDL